MAPSPEEYDFKRIEEKWRKRWAKEALGKAERDPSKPKFFLHFAYPTVSGYQHVGHMRGYSYSDIICRYKRARGYNVLFPGGSHASGNAARGFAAKLQRKDKDWIAYLESNGFPMKRIKEMEDPQKFVQYFNENYQENWRTFGFMIDYDRFTCTVYPDYQRFIQWQFRKLKEHGYLVQAPYFATFCLNCGPVAVDPSEMDVSKGGNARQDEYTLLKFQYNNEKNVYILAATLRPETVFGQTNLWIDPNLTYSKVKKGSETWIVSKECAQKLAYQQDGVKEAGSIKGKDMLGKYALAPGVNREIIILPASFCDPTVGTGIVTSVPSDAPDDWIGLRDLQQSEKECKKYGLDWAKIKAIKPIAIIRSKDFGEMPALKVTEQLGVKDQNDREKLDEAKKIVYSKGFYTGVMLPSCGEYAGMSVEEAKEKMKADLIAADKATTMQDLSEEVVCRCGGPVFIKRVDDQWFIKYSDRGWTDQSKQHAQSMDVMPEEYYDNLPKVLEWFQNRPCARLGKWLGTPFPFDEKWTIEPIADSTLYPLTYIMSRFTNSKRIKNEQLTEELFDYAILGKGDKNAVAKKTGVAADVLQEFRDDVLYWYPTDINLGGKEHKTVHFPVYVMNHVGLLPEKMWPRGIFVHWYITGKGGKISKSKGGAAASPQKAAELYSVDGLRLYYAHAGSPFVDVEWDEPAVDSYRSHVQRFWNSVNALMDVKGNAETSLDDWVLSSTNKKVATATELMESYDLRKALDVALFDMLKDVAWYLKRGAGNKRVALKVADAWVRMMTPFTPFICEELWSSMGNKALVSVAKWPDVDEKQINEQATLSEEMIMGLETDVQRVMQLTNVEKPKQITLIVAPKWKRSVYQKAAGIANPKELIQLVMKDPEIKKQGADAAKYTQFLSKHSAELTKSVLSVEQESEALADAVEFLTERFGCKIVVESGETSKNPRAKNAIPMKPAIFVE